MLLKCKSSSHQIKLINVQYESNIYTIDSFLHLYSNIRSKFRPMKYEMNKWYGIKMIRQNKRFYSVTKTYQY